MQLYVLLCFLEAIYSRQGWTVRWPCMLVASSQC